MRTWIRPSKQPETSDDVPRPKIATIDPERYLLNDYDLNDLQRAQLAECLIDHPQNPWSSDHPLVALREDHRREWESRIGSRKSEESAESRAAARAAKAEAAAAAETTPVASPEPAAPIERRCIDCDAIIAPTGRRGRPNKRCEPCRIEFEAKEAAKAADPARECGACRRGGRGRHLSTCKNNKEKK